MESTFVARWAGRELARSATEFIGNATTLNVSGSGGPDPIQHRGEKASQKQGGRQPDPHSE